MTLDYRCREFILSLISFKRCSYGCSGIREASGALHGHHEEEHLPLRGTAGEDVRLQHGSSRSWAVGGPHPEPSRATPKSSRQPQNTPRKQTRQNSSCCCHLCCHYHGHGHLENLKVSTKGWVEAQPAPPLCFWQSIIKPVVMISPTQFHIFGSKWHVSPTI